MSSSFHTCVNFGSEIGVDACIAVRTGPRPKVGCRHQQVVEYAPHRRFENGVLGLRAV